VPDPSLPIVTPSLRLRHFVVEDGPRILALSQEDAARRWLVSQVYRDAGHAQKVLQALISAYTEPGDPRRGPYVLAVEHRGSGSLVGHVGFSPLGEAVEIGFAMAEALQGRGLATEAVVAASRWVMASFGLAQIIGVTAADNEAARHTMARAGFGHVEDKKMIFQGTEQGVSVYAFACAALEA